MATPGISNSQQPLSTPPVQPAVPPRQTYLQRTVEELDPKLISSHESNATLWNVAAKVILVAFVIVAVGAFIAAGIFVPAYLPLVAVAAFCLMNPTLSLHNLCKEVSYTTEQLAERLKKTAQKFESLPAEPRLLGVKLLEKGIAYNTLPGVQGLDDLVRLKPLIAQYDYWAEQQAFFERQARECIQNAEEAVRAPAPAAEGNAQSEASNAQAPAPSAQPAAAEEPSNPSAIKEKVKLFRIAAINAQQSALICKTQAAFAHAVIKRPEFAGSVNDLVELNLISLKERAIAREFNDPTADDFLLFKQRDIQAITITQLHNDETMPISRLADLFIQAMAAPAAV